MAMKKSTTAKKSTSTKKSSASVGISLMGSNKAEMRKWEVESAMSTLKRAAEIQKDAKLMADVKKMATEQAKMFTNLANGKMK
jgi:hypothetical protein